VTFLQLCLLLASPVSLFMMAHMLFPDPAGPTDMRAHYVRQAPLIWGFALFGTAMGTVAIPLSMGDSILRPNNLSGFPMALLFLVLIFSKTPRVHEIVAPLILLMLVLDTVLPGWFITA
jgi:hypothetical protein